MPKGDFVWCDLSAHDLERACGFYGTVFGWDFYRTEGPDGSDYLIAEKNGTECAALFDMPGRFKEMGLPSFWMSYIQVEDADRVVDTAERLGGKVEVRPAADRGGARVALIRDPLGAGFTVYEGDGMQPRSASRGHGTLAWNALHLSAADPVIPFYEAMFDWRIEPSGPWGGRYRVFARSGAEVAEFRELDEAVRGSFHYWAVYFAVADIRATAQHAMENAGALDAEETIDLGASRLIYDPDGAGFFICETAV